MKTAPLLALACASALLASCSDKASANPGDAGLLAKYHKDIKSILTEERLRQVVDPGSENVTVAAEESGNSLSVSWTWPSDRMLVTDLGFTKIETPASNQLAVSQFRMLTGSEFGPQTGKE